MNQIVCDSCGKVIVQKLYSRDSAVAQGLTSLVDPQLNKVYDLCSDCVAVIPWLGPGKGRDWRAQ